MRSRAFGLALVLALALMLFGAEKGRRWAPRVHIDGVVNGASFVIAPDNLVAPNSIVSIFGVDLSLRTQQVTRADMVGGRLPFSLGGVQVVIGGLLAPIYYVSPTQINAQLPAALAARDYRLRIVRESLRSTEAVVRVRAAAPGLFPVVLHSDFSLVGRVAGKSTPARPGETIVLFGTGFGPTIPAVLEGELPNFIAPIQFPPVAWLNGQRLADNALQYVGQAPKFAGLYQVNLELPTDIPSGNLEIVIGINGVQSQRGLTVAVEP
jgi:uncharacterized protein (TIGR03437 family)